MKAKILILSVLALALAPLTAHAQFAQITNGPNATSTCPPGTPPLLTADVSTNILSSCGTAGTASTLQTTLCTLGAQTAVTTVTTAQTIATCAMPTNAMNHGGTSPRVLRVCGYGVYTTPGTTAPVPTFQIVIAGVTQVAITTAALSTTASTNMPFQFCYDLTTVTLGTTGTLEAHGQLSIGIGANTPAAAETTYQDTNVLPSAATNLNTANSFLFQVSSTLAISSVQVRQLTAEWVS
jgi:hypothetical protein